LRGSFHRPFGLAAVAGLLHRRPAPPAILNAIRHVRCQSRSRNSGFLLFAVESDLRLLPRSARPGRSPGTSAARKQKHGVSPTEQALAVR